MTASAIATFMRARSRTLWVSGRSLWSIRSSAARSQSATGGSLFQNSAVSVCQAVRTVLVALPIALISLKSLAYCALVRAGGGGGRNWPGEVIAHGVIVANCRNAAGANASGVG